jgi:hypothetical protein
MAFATYRSDLAAVALFLKPAACWLAPNEILGRMRALLENQGSQTERLEFLGRAGRPG